MSPAITRLGTSSATDAAALLDQLRSIVGAQYVLTGEGSTRRYRTGFRFGVGKALAVVRPSSLVELWRVVNACVAAGTIIIMQAANTGLTGGSTPDGDDYDRDIVIVSTLRMNRIHVINDGRQVVCFPGATLDLLERTLEPMGREPHSVIGSSCIGASVFGGVCNNSGGALVQRGPAYTEMSLYAQVDATGELHLVNHLGIDLGDDAETMLDRLDHQSYGAKDIHAAAGKGHDDGYAQHVREVDAPTPARFNADTKRLHEAAGCAGKLIVFAVRLDTFPAEVGAADFYVGTNDTQELTRLRRDLLTGLSGLPISGEYIHRDAFDIGETYGKDTFLAINYLGTRHLPKLFAAKAFFDVLFDRIGFLPRHLTDRVMQVASKLFPRHLPKRMIDFRDRYEHHLILKVSSALREETRNLLDAMFPSANGAYFECSKEEGKKAFLHRFAVAGAAVRYRAIHEKKISGLVALDIALKRNERAWFEHLPQSLNERILIKLYYGHFLCHVFHQDYIIKQGYDVMDVEHDMWKILDQRGAEYPAEHNVGHLYNAKPDLERFYRAIDPCNAFNPGVGRTSKLAHWHAPGPAAKP